MHSEHVPPEVDGSHFREKTLPFFIDEKEFYSHEQFITGAKLREIGSIPADWTILLAIRRPWEDEIIENDNRIDLAREGIERFITRKPHERVLVDISVNDVKYELKRGKHSVAQIKAIGKVPPENELEELIDGQLVPLDDTAIVLIKGCEQFFGHVRDGKSS